MSEFLLAVLADQVAVLGACVSILAGLFVAYAEQEEARERGRIGVMICADRTDPAIVRRFCDNNADFLICPSGGMFGPKSNDPILQARSRENKKHIVFVHPAEFLVTGPDGSILDRTILGDRLLVAKEEMGGEKDQNRVFYFDLPVRREAPSQ